jgi:hypothetical protein
VTPTVAPEAATASEVPLAVTQPIGSIVQVFAPSSATRVLPEPGMIMLVGSGLLGLAMIVRRSTRE